MEGEESGSHTAPAVEAALVVDSRTRKRGRTGAQRDPTRQDKRFKAHDATAPNSAPATSPPPLTVSYHARGGAGAAAAVPRRVLCDPTRYRFRRRQMVRGVAPRNAIYVSGSSAQRGLEAKARELLFQEQYEMVTVHAAGAAIPRAVRAALALVERHGEWLDTHVRTSSVPLLDEYEPQAPGLPYVRQVRVQSAVHIDLFKTKKPPAV
eukprot:ctg_1424.g434